MAQVLIVYGTKEGYTTKIVERIAAVATEQGHTVTVCEGKTLSDDVKPAAFDAVMIGASVHCQTLPSTIRKFVKTHRDV